MTTPQNQKHSIALNVKASDEDLKGHYANAMQIAHTPDEFILDFFLIHSPVGQLTTRVITSPGHIKRIIVALQDNLKKYEQQFGQVKATEAPSQEFGFKS